MPLVVDARSRAPMCVVGYTLVGFAIAMMMLCVVPESGIAIGKLLNSRHFLQYLYLATILSPRGKHQHLWQVFLEPIVYRGSRGVLLLLR